MNEAELKMHWFLRLTYRLTPLFLLIAGTLIGLGLADIAPIAQMPLAQSVLIGLGGVNALVVAGYALLYRRMNNHA